jgi:hypothetical protein
MVHHWKRFGKRYGQAFLKKVGIEVYWRKPGYHYVPDYYGCKASKHIDIRSAPPFGRLAKDVIEQSRTLLYYDRLYTIFQALANLKTSRADAEWMDLVEIGVYKGGSSYFIASVLKNMHLTKARLHCFDTFEGHAIEDLSVEGDPLRKPSDFSDTEVNEVKSYLSRFENVNVYKGRFQDTCNQVSSYRFHFVHVDVDLYEPTRFILEFINPRLVRKGVFIVDDYGFQTCPGVKLAVDEFVESNTQYFHVHLLTGQCVLVKLSD